MLQTYRAARSRALRLPLELGALAIDHPQEPVSRPNGIQLHQWRMCARGEGELLLGEKRYRLAPGMGFILWANVPHAYRAADGGMTMDAVGFGGPACAEILRALRLPESGVYRFSEPEAFHRGLEALWSLRSGPDKGAPESVSTRLYALLLQTARGVRAVPEPLTQARLRTGFVPEMIGYMEEHWAETLSLDDMSERFGRAKEYICSTFRREVGITYVDFLTRLRIFHARVLLLDHPEMKVAEVAARCGFASASYFGMVFKKDVGVSPGMYRLTERGRL